MIFKWKTQPNGFNSSVDPPIREPRRGEDIPAMPRGARVKRRPGFKRKRNSHFIFCCGVHYFPLACAALAPMIKPSFSSGGLYPRCSPWKWRSCKFVTRRVRRTAWRLTPSWIVRQCVTFKLVLWGGEVQSLAIPFTLELSIFGRFV